VKRKEGCLRWFSTGPNEIYDLSILSEKPTIFITLISDHFKLKALYGVAPGHQSLKHVFPTGGTHVAPSRNRTIVMGGRDVFLVSEKDYYLHYGFLLSPE